MILLIGNNRKSRNSISEILYYMGVLSYSCSPSESIKEINPHYKAVIIVEPENIPILEIHIDRLKTFCKGIPFFALSDSDNYNKELFCKSFRTNIYSSTLLSGIIDFCNENNLNPPGSYRGVCFDANVGKDQSSYLYFNTEFTKTENMILRYLIVTYPKPVTTKEISKYSFKPTKKPELSGIRTHLCKMNKKFLKIANRPLTITFQRTGYVLFSPRTLSELKEKISST